MSSKVFQFAMLETEHPSHETISCIWLLIQPDSGTAFELGYALALGKKLWAYVDSAEPMLERIRRIEALSADVTRDSQGMAIEDFGLPVNLMLALTARMVEGDLATCIAAIRPRAKTLPQATVALATQE